MKYIFIILLLFGCGPKEQSIHIDAGNNDSENTDTVSDVEFETETENNNQTGGGSESGSSTNPYADSIPDDYVPQPLPSPLPEPMPSPDTDSGGAISFICKFLPKNPICDLGGGLGDGAVNGIICSILPNLGMCNGDSVGENPKPQPSNPIKVCEDKIIFEAENFTSQSGYSVIDHAGAKVIQVGDSGVAKYSLNFPKAGRWYVHLRTMAEGHTDNGVYLNFDGQRVKAPSDHQLAGVSQIWLMKNSVWSWKPKFQGGHSEAAGPVTIDVPSAGLHEFAIEKKLVERPYIDKIVLATSDLDSSVIDSLTCDTVTQPEPQPQPEPTPNPTDKLYFNIIIEQTLEPCGSCGIIFDWEGNEERKPTLIVNHGNGAGEELKFRDEVSSISLGGNRFNNKQSVMLVKKQVNSKGYLIADISRLPKESPINEAKLCMKLHSKEGLANADKSSVLEVYPNNTVWNYSTGASGQKNGFIREIRADRDFWGQGISKANPWGCYDFTEYVTALQGAR